MSNLKLDIDKFTDDRCSDELLEVLNDPFLYTANRLAPELADEVALVASLLNAVEDIPIQFIDERYVITND